MPYLSEAMLPTYTESLKSSINYHVGDDVRHDNLLDNSWFKVNSRGQLTYICENETYKFCVDRWYMNGNCIFMINDSDVTFQNFDADNPGYLAQTINNVELGNTYTLSIGSYGTTFEFSSSSGEICNYQLDNDSWVIVQAENEHTITIKLYVKTNKNIKAMKLEKGVISTLGNDLPPEYQLERIRCLTNTALSQDIDAYSGHSISMSSVEVNPSHTDGINIWIKE